MVTGDRIPGTTDTNGLVTISNLYGGVVYLAVLQGTYKTTSNYYQFPITNGLINAADYVTNMPSASTAGGAYTAAQSDSRYIANRNGVGTNATAVSNFFFAVPGLATNTFTFTNKVIYAIGEDTNIIIVSGAGTASANSTNRLSTANIPSAGHLVYTNVLGPNFPSVVRNPDFFYSDDWAITNASGTELYFDSTGPNNTLPWGRTGGANPGPIVTYGYTTNSFTNFTSTFNLPWPISRTNILYVSPIGNDYSAVRGDPTHPWRHVSRAYTNMLYQFDVMSVMPGVFDETREIIINDSLPELPANCSIVGAGRGISKIVGSGALSRLRFGSSNRLEHISLETVQIYTGTASHSTNFLCQDVEAHCDGDVWVAEQGNFFAWDPFIIDCDFSGNSDKIAVLTAGPTSTPPNNQTNSRIYIINTRISGGVGADGDGLNRGFTTADGVRGGQFVNRGVHIAVTGNTNSLFMGLSSQVSTSGTFTATTKMFTPAANVSGLTANRLVMGNGSKDLASAAASGAVPVDADGSATTAAQVNAIFPGNLVSNGASFAVTFSNNFTVDATHKSIAAHISGQLGPTPTAVTNVACGPSSVLTLDANARDSGFNAKLVTGPTPAVGQIFHLTFGTAYTTAPHVVWSHNSLAAGLLGGRVYTTNQTTAGFDFFSGGTPMTANTNYEWQFIIIE
jgi:hypothetical protein